MIFRRHYRMVVYSICQSAGNITVLIAVTRPLYLPVTIWRLSLWYTSTPRCKAGMHPGWDPEGAVYSHWCIFKRWDKNWKAAQTLQSMQRIWTKDQETETGGNGASHQWKNAVSPLLSNMMDFIPDKLKMFLKAWEIAVTDMTTMFQVL